MTGNRQPRLDPALRQVILDCIAEREQTRVFIEDRFAHPVMGNYEFPTFRGRLPWLPPGSHQFRDERGAG